MLYGQQSDTTVVETDSTVVTTITTNKTTSTPSNVSEPAAKPENNSSGQENNQTPKERKDTRPVMERISPGFGSSFWANSRETYVEVVPSLAYRFPKLLIAGVGYRYIWRKQRNIDETLRTYGPTFFARLNIIPKLYGWTEYEILKNEYMIEPPAQPAYKTSSAYDSWFVGAGYVKSVGRKGRGGLSVQLLYNVLYDKDNNSPYYSPVTYRVGYYF